MSVRRRLLICFALCLAIVGCGAGGDDEQQDQGLDGGNQAKDQDAKNPPVAPKPKKEKKEPVLAKAPSGTLRTYLPGSLSIAVGADLAALPDISAITGTDFITELRPVTKLIAKAGIAVEEIKELWVGSNPDRNEMAVCVRTKKQYDRDKVRKGLSVAESLGKIDGSELHALQPDGTNKNAIAFIDSQTFMIGRRSTVEAGLKRPPAGPVRNGLEVAGTPHAPYWVGGTSKVYLQQLMHHGFPELATKIGTSLKPLGFALSIGKDLPAVDMDKKQSTKQRRKRNHGGGHLVISASAKPVVVVMGFQFKTERAATEMEHRILNLLVAMQAKLQAEANIESTLAAAAEREKIARQREADNANEEDSNKGDNARRRRGRRHGRRRDRRRDRDRDTDRAIVPRNVVKERRQGNENRPAAALVPVNFKYSTKREATNLRVTVIFELKPMRTSVAAAIVRAIGNSPEENGIFQGGFSTIAGGVADWRNEHLGRLRGLKRLPGLPVVAGYGWLTELLPYVDQQNVYLEFDFKRSWVSDPENRRLAGTVVPAFLDPTAKNAKWDGYPFDGLGLTHFVGMAGVEDGPNVVAATLSRGDPRAGIFGYDAIAAPRNMTDGASNTIMMIGAGRLAGPWIQGGGATIRGAREPYFDEVSGFGSTGLSNPGARVLFADGSSRVISADIDPAVFRALCTIHGGESVDRNQANPKVKQTTAADSPSTKQ